MKTYQLRDLKDKDLQITLKDNVDALENYRFQHATGQLENYKAMANAKKVIAKVKTLLRERELNINTKKKK
ncbi:MAG: 50S ribosomal protein L29 [Ignavibacteria bacterium]|nr:50S ribosomal protein L29 [Ignavibacteria bacterium]